MHYQDYPDITTEYPLRYVVSLSSGAGSAAAADVILQRHGKQNVDLVFADTLWEDDDNYRFLRDLSAYWQKPIKILRDGRTPLQVFEDAQLVPNDMFAPCTSKLKIKLLVGYVKNLIADGHMPVMVIGHGAKDARPRRAGQVYHARGRLHSPIRNWSKVGALVSYPLLPPIKLYSDDGSILSYDGVPIDPQDYVKYTMGIDLPRMYQQGYSHANCGGRCVKQGIKDWKRTLEHHPARFAEVEAWEAQMRKDERFADRTILTRVVDGERVNYPLSQLREDVRNADGHQLKMFDMMGDIEGTCGTECGVGSDWMLHRS